jgi:hypothetical protein
MYTVYKMSLGRRTELTKRLRELLGKITFLEAGAEPKETVEAALLANEVESAYLRWGLVELRGLEIDGQAATPETLMSAGPEELCREIAAAVKTECGLSEAERKN